MDRNNPYVDEGTLVYRRSPCGSVDRNVETMVRAVESGVAPLAGAWIEMLPMDFTPSIWSVAPLAGAWIEMVLNKMNDVTVRVAPLAGAWIEIPCRLPMMTPVPVAPLAGAWIEISLALRSSR